MTAPRVLDAHELLATPIDAETLRDDTPIVVLLDLRWNAPQWASAEGAPVRLVADVVATRAAAGHDITLLAATGMLDPRWAAGLAAPAFIERGQADAPLAVVGGEDVAGQLEAWHQSGEGLRERDRRGRLFDDPRMPFDAYAPAPPAPIRAARSRGARAVFTAYARPETHRAAIDPSRTITTDDATIADRGEVLVWLEAGYTLDLPVALATVEEAPSLQSAAERFAELTGVAASHKLVADTPSGDPMLLIHAESAEPKERHALVRFADLLATVLSRGTGADGRRALLEGPAPARLIRRRGELWRTDVASERLQYAVDLRPAGAWPDELPG